MSRSSSATRRGQAIGVPPCRAAAWDDLQVLKASENKRDHRLSNELETLLNGGRVSWGFLVWAGVAAFVGWVVFG